MTAPVYIIAEIASSHEGDPSFALRLARLAARTGADAIKFQIFNRDALVSRVHAKYESFGEIEIAPLHWRKVLHEARGLGRDIVVEAFDEFSLALAEKSGAAAAYKIPTSDIGNRALIEAAAAAGKRLFLGVGGATDGEIDEAVGWLKAARADVVLLHGFQAYPTRLEDTNLARLPALAARYGLPVGYADHVDAEDREMARLVPIMAAAAGAIAIEKHITDDRGRKGRDHYSALNPDEFADFVRLLRRAEATIGAPDSGLSPAELDYRFEMKRQAVATRDLPPGTRLASEHVAFKRIGRAGLDGLQIEGLIGRPLRTAKYRDEPLDAGDFDA